MEEWANLKDYEKAAVLESRAAGVKPHPRGVTLRNPSLCVSCENGLVFRRRGDVDATFYCKDLDKEMPNDIVECTRYEDPQALTLTELVGIALNIDPRVGVHDKSFL